jgi:hypothetical protein
MISSPCKTCEKRNQPKEDCYKDCKLIQAIQVVESCANRNLLASGIDCSEENRFTVHLSTTNSLTQFN